MPTSPPSALAALCLCREEGNLGGLSVKNHDGSGISTGWDTSSQPLDLRIPLHHLQMDTGCLSIISRWTSGTCPACVPLPRTSCVPHWLSVLASVEAASFTVGRRGLCSSPAPASAPTKAFSPPCLPSKAAWPGYLGSRRAKGAGQTLRALPGKATRSRREERNERSRGRQGSQATSFPSLWL